MVAVESAQEVLREVGRIQTLEYSVELLIEVFINMCNVPPQA